MFGFSFTTCRNSPEKSNRAARSRGKSFCTTRVLDGRNRNSFRIRQKLRLDRFSGKGQKITERFILCNTATLAFSAFSVVRTKQILPHGFPLTAEAITRNFFIHFVIILRASNGSRLSK